MDGKAFSGLLGLMAAALSPDEAEAAPKPKYMHELTEKLKNGDYTPMDFGHLTGAQLRKLQQVDPSFTEGPLKLSGKNIEKFARKRIELDHIDPETFVDGLNSVFHGSRSRAFPDGRGSAKLFMPDGDYAWRGVAAPHDGFSGLVTGYRYPVEDMKKELLSSSDGRPFPSYPNNPKEGALPGRLTTVEEDKKLSDAPTVSGTPSSGKENMAVLAVPASAWASMPVDMSPTMFDRVMRDMGIGARGVVEGLGTGATLGMGNPGRYVADWLNLPEARTETEKRRKGTVQGIADAVPMIAGGAGAARAAMSPVVRGVGASLASTPKTDAALGGLLGYFMGGD